MVNVSVETFELFVDYIYTKTISLSVENVGGLYVFSDQYQIEEIHSFCYEFIKESLGTDSIIPYYKLSTQCHDDKLLQKCLKFIIKHTKDVLESKCFLELAPIDLIEHIVNQPQLNCSESELLNGILMWSEFQAKTNTELSKFLGIAILDRIKFPFVSIELMIKVRHLNVYPKVEILLDSFLYQLNPKITGTNTNNK
uniref:BACK domain-containing protein n=1 Tax=Arcella intermedia TaxID=1963864 RepID=A0A6B2LJ52_9EUKA